MNKSTHNLYYQVQRLRKTKQKLSSALENEKIKNNSNSLLFHKKDVFFKNLIVAQSISIVIGIIVFSYIY